MSSSLDAHGIAVLILTGVALVLFTRERLPLEGSALFVLITLALGLYLFPYQGAAGQMQAMDVLAGFGNEALIAIVALLVCSRALDATGALHPFAHLLSRIWRRRPRLAFLCALLLSGTLSMFVNNTPVVAMMLPLMVSVCLRAGVPPSGVLMPMGFATIVGGMATTIGTSTNLLVVGVASKLGARPIGMFDFTPLVLVAFAAAVLFLWLVAPRLLPARTPPMRDIAPRVFEGALRIPPGSVAAGRTLAELNERTGHQICITGIERSEELYLAPHPSLVVQAGDQIHVRDTAANLKDYERVLRAELTHGRRMRRVRGRGASHAAPEHLAEIVVTRRSPLYGRRLSALPLLFEQQFSVLGTHRIASVRSARDQEPLAEDQRLREGDIVLIQGGEEAIRALKDTDSLIVLDGALELPHTRHAPRAATVMIAVIVSAALGLVPISIAALVGVSAMLVLDCLTWRQLRDAIDRRLVLIIVASLALGQALTITGGTGFVAGLFVNLVDGLSPAVVVSGLMLLMALVTEIVTNNAAAVLGTPIALDVAARLGTDAEPLVLAVLFGANMSYLLPMGYQTNLMVLAVGGYHVRDFLRVGLPLQIIVWATLSIMLAISYPG